MVRLKGSIYTWSLSELVSRLLRHRAGLSAAAGWRGFRLFIPPPVRLYPGRLSDTGCHEVGWAQDKLLFLRQSNEGTDKQAERALRVHFLTQISETMEDLLAKNSITA